eukprot:466559_1
MPTAKCTEMDPVVLRAYQSGVQQGYFWENNKKIPIAWITEQSGRDNRDCTEENSMEYLRDYRVFFDLYTEAGKPDYRFLGVPVLDTVEIGFREKKNMSDACATLISPKIGTAMSTCAKITRVGSILAA